MKISPGYLTLNTWQKKLSCQAGLLNKLKDQVPPHLHKDLYHTLFESHLRYGISAWGGVSKSKLSPLFVIQKKCIRIMFGDKQAYIDKFKTCAKVRPLGQQKLGTKFFELEHTKPLFNNNSILTVFNLYKYHCVLETYKILKMRTPIAIFQCFSISARKETLLISPKPSDIFIYIAIHIWNDFCNKIQGITDFSYSMSKLKTSVHKILTSLQLVGEPCEWQECNY